MAWHLGIIARVTTTVVGLSVTLLLTSCDGDRPENNPANSSVHPAPLKIAAIERQDPSLSIGVNLPPIYDWALTPVMVDLVHQARRFGSPETPWDEAAELADDGWPIGDFGVFLATRQAGSSHFPGTYTVRFRGKATVTTVASRASIGTSSFDPVENTTTVLVTVPEDGNQLALAFTDTGPGIKHLQVIRPGYDPATPPLFTREFLEHIAPFRTVRVMDWLRSNNNPVRSWDERATPEYPRYASPRGMPWEYVTELAIVSNKDLWINIPAHADDGYVRELAGMLKRELPATTRLYLEYSNEVWNAQFEQHAQNRALAIDAVSSGPDARLDHDGSGNPDVWAIRRIAQRGKEISDLFREVFGDAAMMTRIRPVFATQVVNPYLTRVALDYIAAQFGPPHHYFFAIAGAPYFNLGARQIEAGLGTDDVLAALAGSIDNLATVNRFADNHDIARRYALPFLAYEGGSDTFGPGSLAAKADASADPRMEGLCRRYLQTWFDSGGGLFMWFHAGAGRWDHPYGSWELTTDIADNDTAKLRCLHSFLNPPAKP